MLQILLGLLLVGRTDHGRAVSKPPMRAGTWRTGWGITFSGCGSQKLRWLDKSETDFISLAEDGRNLYIMCIGS